MSNRQRPYAIVANTTGRTGARLATFRTRCIAWEAAGCSPRAAAALAHAEIDVVDQISGLGQGFFERLPNCGPATVTEIGAFIGGWSDNDEATTIDGIADEVARVDARGSGAQVANDILAVRNLTAVSGLLSGLFTNVVVVGAAGQVVIDVQADLSVVDAVRLRDQLSEVIAAVQPNKDPCQMPPVVAKRPKKGEGA